ncbi:MAG: hypothetical protein HOH74_19440, partial [Gemmatimonadetes bacterium]|nr:hypothetical protein [Gemmatimonadota bacterium]
MRLPGSGVLVVIIMLGVVTPAVMPEAMSVWGQSPGYIASTSQILVGRQGDWQAWDVAEGSTQIDGGGTVRPRLLRGELNAMLDADQFDHVRAGGDTVRGGVMVVGSSPETAELIRDGDVTTGWSPDRRASLASWFIDLDLGRTVTAERVVVRFAAEGEGDPFLKFRVMASAQTRLTNEDLDIEFFRVGQVTVRNKDTREFEFIVRPQRRVPEGLTGEVIQTIRFEALDTDRDRAHEITLAQFLELPEEEQGATEFYRQTVSGRTILVDRETWEALPTLERGPVRYFRWEQPQLMELEVYTPGQNIAHLTQIEINRTSSAFDNPLRYFSTDGLATPYPIRPYDALRDDNQLEIDLGAKFWLDRIRLVTETPLSAYQILTSDGALDPNGDRRWREFGERLNPDQYQQLEERFPLDVVRFIQLRALQFLGTEVESGRIRELQAYGQGYVSDIELTSPIIRLPTSSMFTQLSWTGDVLPDTRIEIRTRSGDDLSVVKRYFDRFDREIGQDQWESARLLNRGPIIETEIPGPL